MQRVGPGGKRQPLAQAVSKLWIDAQDAPYRILRGKKIPPRRREK